MKVGYVEDWTGAATQKVVLIDETISGKFVCKQMPIEITSINGTRYYAESLTGLFLRSKDAVFDIHEEEVKAG